MKKLTRIIIIIFLASVFSGCPPKSETILRTIRSVDVLLFSFSEYGIFPHTDSYNRNKLGVGIFADSLFDSYELARSFSFISSAYAMEPRYTTVYTNAIDSLNVFTVYDFNEEHPAGSNINDILLLLDSMGDTEEIAVNELSSETCYFKFSAVPQNDTIQFRITGRITYVGTFDQLTERIILSE